LKRWDNKNGHKKEADQEEGCCTYCEARCKTGRAEICQESGSQKNDQETRQKTDSKEKGNKSRRQTGEPE
jgi:hypothetical protein